MSSNPGLITKIRKSIYKFFCLKQCLNCDYGFWPLLLHFAFVLGTSKLVENITRYVELEGDLNRGSLVSELTVLPMCHYHSPT